MHLYILQSVDALQSLYKLTKATLQGTNRWMTPNGMFGTLQLLCQHCFNAVLTTSA